MLILLVTIWVLWTMTGKDPNSPSSELEALLDKEIGEDQEMMISGTVAKCSTVSSGIRLFMDHISILSENNSKISFLPEQKITVTTDDESIMPGDQLIVRGIFAPFEAAGNPGQFDMRDWYFRQDAVCSLKKTAILQHESGDGGLQAFLYRIRIALRTSYQKILPEKAAATITAITLGDKGYMETEWKEQYQEGGIAHIIAVSGLHITMIGMGAYRFLRWICLPILPSALLSAAATVLYGILTGSGISAMRAVVMFLVWLGAQIAGRRYDQLTALAIAAAVLILPDTRVTAESSFWLSFGAVLTLAVLVPQIKENCRIRTGIGNSICSSIGIWIGMLPLTLYFFYQAIPWSIAVNLLVIPLMSAVMSYGLLSGTIGLFSQSAGVFFGAPVQYLLRFFDLLCEQQQKLPGAVWVAGRPTWHRIVLYYILLLAGVLAGKQIWKIWKKKPGKAKTVNILIWSTVLIFGSVLMSVHRQEQLEIISLDVGQGDGAIVRLPGGVNCLIDCGSSSVRELWDYRAEPALKYYGIRTLDYVFLSHADQDHVNGILQYLQEYECGYDGRNVHGITLKNLVLPVSGEAEGFDELIQLAKENGIHVFDIKAGDAIKIAEGSSAANDKADKTNQTRKNSQADVWQISCLAPVEESLTGDSNQDSMVLMVQYGTFRMLFTGDLEGEAENSLIDLAQKQQISLAADVLKVGHHGSKNASSELFLETVKPKAAVISCGKDNSYGHPAKETLERLKQCGVSVIQTMENGAVQIVSDGQSWEIYTFS